MGFRISIGKKKIINLIIKDHVIRFVDLKTTNPPIVQHYGERYLPAGIIHDGKIVDLETFEVILEECVSDWKIDRRLVRFIVPDSFVIIRKISVPLEIEDDEMHGYIFMEIGSSIHLPFENPVFDYVRLGQKESQQELLLFAGPEEVIQEYAAALEEAKLKPLSADISSLALFRLYDQQNTVEKENIMLVQVDLKSVNICIFENKNPVVMRHLMMDVDISKWERGKNHLILNTYLGDQDDIYHPLEDAYLEIDRVRNFYNYSLNQGSKLVSKLLLDGDHPWLDEIEEKLKNQFDIPVIRLESQNNVVGDARNMPSSYHLNIGLGLKEVD
ncbi:type IV pilus biogenesis protein PilM [Niallia oryzisoli]|uniref:type IV pilus biogenesis protein PilM n=1 Tax=Niallia oryzisoli TaxID=1737571 RepID=UPI003735756B